MLRLRRVTGMTFMMDAQDMVRALGVQAHTLTVRSNRSHGNPHRLRILSQEPHTIGLVAECFSISKAYGEYDGPQAMKSTSCARGWNAGCCADTDEPAYYGGLEDRGDALPAIESASGGTC